MRYFMFFVLNGIKYICCCIAKRYDTPDSQSWYRVHMQRLRKFEVARDKLADELELESFIRTKRIQSFAIKNWMNRR